MAREAAAAAAPKKTADERIAECPPRAEVSFSTLVPAQARRTSSRVWKSSSCPTVADRLRRDGQQIACVTYTTMWPRTR